jgi:hypothetical protein
MPSAARKQCCPLCSRPAERAAIVVGTGVPYSETCRAPTCSARDRWHSECLIGELSRQRGSPYSITCTSCTQRHKIAPNPGTGSFIVDAVWSEFPPRINRVSPLALRWALKILVHAIVVTFGFFLIVLAKTAAPYSTAYGGSGWDVLNRTQAERIFGYEMHMHTRETIAIMSQRSARTTAFVMGTWFLGWSCIMAMSASIRLSLAAFTCSCLRRQGTHGAPYTITLER